MNCIRVAREGGTIAIAPEGNRTFNGETVYMSDAIAPLAKKLKLPIALYRLEGGYGVHPRWSDVVRKGKMRSYVSRVIEPEEYAKMSNQELFDIIQKELYVDEAVADSCFQSDRKAEYLERAMYVCPWCGLTEYKSQGNEITCQKCGKTITYGEDKSLKGVNCDFPFPFVKQWYQHQMDLVNSLDLTQNTDTPLFTDRVDVSRVILYKQKQKLSENVTVKLYPDRILLNDLQGKEQIFFFDRITVITVLGKNKLNIYYDKQIYQFKGDARFNALKYVNLCHRYKNQMRGDENVEFLGL
jgi:hypothetical protein